MKTRQVKYTSPNLLAGESLHPGLDGEDHHVDLVVLAEESLAVGLGLLLVDELVEVVEVRLSGAVNVVPPVTHEVLLVEDCAVGAEESGGISIGCAHVEGLKWKWKFNIAGTPGKSVTLYTNVLAIYIQLSHLYYQQIRLD